MSGNEEAGAGGALAGKRVLLVEDETLVAMLLEDMIGDLGGSVAGSASRIQQALDIVADPAAAIDLAVLDVNLAGEEVFPVAAALQARGVPFAFSTGYGNSNLPAEWRARPTLQKPFMLEEVRAVLERALASG